MLLCICLNKKKIKIRAINKYAICCTSIDRHIDAMRYSWHDYR